MRLRMEGSIGCGLLLLAAGCSGSGLHDERTLLIAPGTDKMLSIDKTGRDQQVRVQVSSPGAPLSVYCFLEKDQAEAERAIRGRSATDKVLAKAEKGEQANLQFTVSANESAVVLLMAASANTASAKVTITGR